MSLSSPLFEQFTAPTSELLKEKSLYELVEIAQMGRDVLLETLQSSGINISSISQENDYLLSRKIGHSLLALDFLQNPYEQISPEDRTFALDLIMRTNTQLNQFAGYDEGFNFIGEIASEKSLKAALLRGIKAEELILEENSGLIYSMTSDLQSETQYGPFYSLFSYVWEGASIAIRNFDLARVELSKESKNKWVESIGMASYFYSTAYRYAKMKVKRDNIETTPKTYQKLKKFDASKYEYLQRFKKFPNYFVENELLEFGKILRENKIINVKDENLLTAARRAVLKYTQVGNWVDPISFEVVLDEENELSTGMYYESDLLENLINSRVPEEDLHHIQEKLRQAMDKAWLTPDEKKIIFSYHYQGRSLRQITQDLMEQGSGEDSLSVETVRQRLFSCYSKIKAVMEGEDIGGRMIKIGSRFFTIKNLRMVMGYFPLKDFHDLFDAEKVSKAQTHYQIDPELMAKGRIVVNIERRNAYKILQRILKAHEDD